MKIQTISITVPASRDDVFTFLADLQNLPHWAGKLCRRIWKAGTCWKALTPSGEMFLALQSEAGTGVIDFFLGEQLDEMAVFPLRVLSQPHGAVVTLTHFQSFGVPNEIYDRQYRLLLSEMRGLLRRFGGGELHASAEGAPAFYPGLVTRKFYETWDFYSANLGFTTVNECGAYVHLSHPSGAQFGLLKDEVDGAPAELISPAEGRGFWLSLDVPDADAEYARLLALGVDVVSPPEDKPWGERHFLVRDPNGVLVYIAHKIPTFVQNEATEMLCSA